MQLEAKRRRRQVIRALGSLRGALVAATGLSGCVLALQRAPLGQPASAQVPLDGVAQELSSAVLASIPLLDLVGRSGLVVMALVLGCGLASCWLAYQLYRGPGRALAAIFAGPLAVASLTSWAQNAPELTTAQLCATLALILSLGHIAGARVHLGLVPPAAHARAVALAGLATLSSESCGLVVLPLVIGSPWLGWGLGGPGIPHSTIRQHALAIATGLIPALCLGLGLALAGHPPALPSVASIHLTTPVLSEPSAGLPVAGTHAGLAMLVLMVVPLRWRAGPLLVLVTGSALVVSNAGGTLVPPPLPICVLAVACAGWIWLAGTMAGTRRRLGAAAAWMATPLAGALVLLPAVQQNELDRPRASETRLTLHRVYEKGLIGPGDALVSFGTWTEHLEQARIIEGWRPDIRVLAGSSASDQEVLDFALEAGGLGARVVSNSYNGGGRWAPEWMLDSGPLFWLVGPGIPQPRDYTNLDTIVPSLAGLQPEERAAWVALLVERSRFRRAVGDLSDSLQALPLDPRRRRAARTRLALAAGAQPAASGGSELADLRSPRGVGPEALWMTEAGDLLFANGEHERASELLADAGFQGNGAALGALARWQLRAGQGDAARRTLRASSHDRSLALGLAQWLLARQRIDEAQLLLGSPSSRASDPAGELGARLHLLTTRARTPQPRGLGSATHTLSRR